MNETTATTPATEAPTKYHIGLEDGQVKQVRDNPNTFPILAGLLRGRNVEVVTDQIAKRADAGQPRAVGVVDATAVEGLDSALLIEAEKLGAVIWEKDCPELTEAEQIAIEPILP